MDGGFYGVRHGSAEGRRWNASARSDAVSRSLQG